MDSSKKLLFPDQFFSARRRNILSRFGLGIAASLVILTLLSLTNSSFNVPFVSPLLQGLRNSNLSIPSSVSPQFNSSGSSSSSNQVDDKKPEVVVPVPSFESEQTRDTGSKITSLSGEGEVSSFESGPRSGETVINSTLSEDGKVSVRNDENTLEANATVSVGNSSSLVSDLGGRLNGTDFLEKLRGKKLVFVGDSINRNMWESLVCILRHSLKDKKRVYEISGRREFKKRGFYAFRFEDYNCTVDFVGSPFFVRESSFRGVNGTTLETLRLDMMDKTTSMYRDADILIFNTGHWWTHDKTKLGDIGSVPRFGFNFFGTVRFFAGLTVTLMLFGRENYYQEGNVVYPRLKVLEAYKRALTTWAKWVDKNIDRNQTHVVFRGYSETHFR
ncbi:hypothetical protein DY000_02012850 [Brassica cretica]|uniref:Trichome birefringence-like C-terminal domain-containing protein n=1 Tax=Brassica cretica TaxID=69181 RepID=A0ABQ7CTQ6_BRACR|nr:hypothetical protein DY000_02012850 [Brassica cretica]